MKSIFLITDTSKLVQFGKWYFRPDIYTLTIKDYEKVYNSRA